MISSVFLNGFVGEFDCSNKIRYVKLERVIPENGGKYKVDKVPVLINRPGTLIESASNGQMICLKGRIETFENVGLVLIPEIEELLSKK